MAAAMRSMPEWAASESMPSEPVRRPVRSLSSVMTRAARTEKSAAERFLERALTRVRLAGSWVAVLLIGEMVQGSGW